MKKQTLSKSFLCFCEKWKRNELSLLLFSFRLVDDWLDDVTLLVMNQVTLTVKVIYLKSRLYSSRTFKLKNQEIRRVKKWVSGNFEKIFYFLFQVANALAKGVPIVTPVFLTDFFVCQNTKQILPDPKQYIPPLGENTINANDVSLAVKKERQMVSC